MTDDGPDEYPLILSAPAVLAVLSGAKTRHRQPVRPSNSTVLGRPAKRYWPFLLFEHADPRAKASLMVVICGGYQKAPDDPHLSVQFRHPDDGGVPIEELGWYRVRPKWEAGDLLRVKETWSRYRGFGQDETDDAPVLYKADRDDCGQYPCVLDGKTIKVNARNPWRSPAVMPRQASRITLEVTGVAAGKSETDGGCGWDWVTDFKRNTP